MLSFWRTTIKSPFLWPTIRSRAVHIYPFVAFGATTLYRNTRAHLRLPLGRSVRLPVSWGRTDFEFVQLIPLLIGAIPLRDGKKFSNPATRINRLWIIHADIMNYTAAHIQHSQ
jgi:hypothetical protein